MNDGKCQMWAIRFKSEFIPETTFQLYSLYHDHASIELQTGTCFDRLDTLCRMMDDEMQQPAPDYAIIRQLLETVFTMIESERRKLGSEYRRVWKACVSKSRSLRTAYNIKKNRNIKYKITYTTQI